MHLCRRPVYRSVSEWLRDTQILHKAYRDTKEDSRLDAEIRKLEYKYLKTHLIDNVGEDEAERILYEHGFESSI